MAWTSPRTWVAAETLTASLMNTHVRDNLSYLYDGAAWSTHSATWTWSGAGTLTSGGTVKYARAARSRMIHVQGFLSVTGLGSSPSGYLEMDLPVTAATLPTYSRWGYAEAYDASGTANYVGSVAPQSTTKVRFNFQASWNGAMVNAYYDLNNDGDGSDSFPFQWATTPDLLMFVFDYEAAS